MTRDQYLHEYAKSHRNALNQRIHLICVPVIFAATVALAWQLSLGFGLNLALIAAPLVLGFYARLGVASLWTGALWMSLSLALCAGSDAAGLPLGWIAATAWGLAWLAQFYGHRVEGRKPSFADDLVFLLIGPLYVQQKWARRDLRKVSG